MLSEKKDKIVYWLFTAPFLLGMAASATAYLSGAPEIIAGFAHLGYPAYLLKILATAKLLGVFAILYGRFTTLKEWAYAGFTINLFGASASHAFSGDSLAEVLMPFVFLSVMLGSYFYWKKSPELAFSPSS